MHRVLVCIHILLHHRLFWDESKSIRWVFAVHHRPSSSFSLRRGVRSGKCGSSNGRTGQIQIPIQLLLKPDLTSCLYPCKGYIDFGHFVTHIRRHL